MAIEKRLWKTVSNNWERIVFSIFGLFLTGYALRLIYIDQIPNGAIVFGIGFLSFIYANVARFKRFKGLGFEAELWEDKKKEAEELIERLKNVVSIYTREVIIGKVKSGRWGAGVDWQSHWKLYDDLIDQHNVLGQTIDFSGIKKIMDDYFLFDMSMESIDAIRVTIDQGKALAMQKINEEFGNPIGDLDGHTNRLTAYGEIESNIDNPFEISTRENLAEHALKLWFDAKDRLRRDFDVDVELDQENLDRLEKVSTLYKTRPVQVTPELVVWGNRRH
ncbi:hypothetical protein VQ045_18725 [Aurantimonas sp. E1-2-R+4]|uniref:hypothetical protein n=1 Tax=Aurantimonas sp. E1-2-R+4 TaxID=3113714 RepID=UPI002F947617